MARTPPGPPHVVNGVIQQPVWDFLLDGIRTGEINIGSVNSGVNEAKAAAAAAQATASGAAANANNANAAAGGGFSVIITPDSASGAIDGGGPVTTSTLMAVPTGGVAPLTYAWSLNTAGFTIQNPTADFTAFDTNLPLFNGELRFDIATVVVTDATLATCTASAGVVATSNNTGPF